MEKVGLNRSLPGFPRDHDVYRRVTKDAERRKVPHNGHQDQFENWLVRDVASRGENVITRRIVCEVVDPAGRKLAYAQVADIEFVRPQVGQTNGTVWNVPSRLNFVWLDGNNEISHPTAKAIMAEVAVQFSKWRGKLGDQAMRQWIRRTILDMGATPVRPSGGIYFLEEKFADQVEALEAFCAEVLPQGGECHSVEIPDNDKQREMIRRSIEQETIGLIERKMVEIAEIRKSGKLTPDKYTEMLIEISEVQKKVGGYKGLLEKDLSALESRLELLAMQTKRLAPFQKKRGQK